MNKSNDQNILNTMDEDDDRERLLLEELERREREQEGSSLSIFSNPYLTKLSTAAQVIGETYINAVLDTKREQDEEDDKFWESVPVLPAAEDDDEEQNMILMNNNRRIENTAEFDGITTTSTSSVLLLQEEERGGGGNFVADLLVNTYKQAQEAEEALERRRRQRVLSELDAWTTKKTNSVEEEEHESTSNRVLKFDDDDDIDTNEVKMMFFKPDVQVGLTARYTSYLSKVLPTNGDSNRKNRTMSDEAQRELDKLEANFTPHRKSKKSFFRDFLQFGADGNRKNETNNSNNNNNSRNDDGLSLDDPALLSAISKEMSKIDKVLDDLKTDVAIKNLANVARNTGGGRLNDLADALDRLAKDRIWEYPIFRYLAMFALLSLFLFAIYVKTSVESREEVGGLIDIGIKRKKLIGL